MRDSCRNPFLFLLLFVLFASFRVEAQGIFYKGQKGPGHGKNVVLIAGDDGEYHSEEALPQLAKILAVRHGFNCTVLFPLDPDGTINPHQNRDLKGLKALRKADLLVLFMRWRDLPDKQMKMLIDYIQSGRPIIVIRTGTHPFWLKTSQTYAKWNWNSTGSWMGRRLRSQGRVRNVGRPSRGTWQAEHASVVCAACGG